MSSQPNIVKIEQLSFAYQKKHLILNNLHLNVPAKSIFAFIGENGAGKSTTLKHIVGLIPHDKGTIQLFGKSLQTHRNEIMTKVGVLIENPSCHLHLSGYDNLKMYCYYRNIPTRQIMVVTDQVGLSNNIFKRCGAYSMGMKQRLGLAIALLGNPELLILDEPTNGLDPVGRIEFRKLLLELNERGKTIIVSSHLLSEIELIATDVGIIKNGTILFEGSMEKLKRLQQKNVLLKSEVSDVQQAALLLKPHYPVVEVNSKTNELKIQISNREDIPHVVHILSSSGIDIYALQSGKKDLEQLFMKFIAEKNSTL